MKKIIIIIIAFIVVVVFGISFFSPTKYVVVIKDKENIENAIEMFLENFNKNGYYKTNVSEFVCFADVVWQYELNENEQIIMANNTCSNFVIKNDMLCSISGGGQLPFFKVRKNDTKFEVIEWDWRFNHLQKTNQDWVVVIENKIPKSLKKCIGDGCSIDDKFFLQKLIIRDEKFKQFKKFGHCENL